MRHHSKWILLFVALLLLYSRGAAAHCDTMHGPVITTAKLALETGNVTPLLRWVQPRFEKDVRDAFDRARAARARGPEAQAVADQWFFETVVRLHRQGEGEPFTGLKEEMPDPFFVATDAASDKGSLEQLQSAIANDINTELADRFQHLLEAKKHASESIEAGRRYVAAYVEFVHYVEALHTAGAKEEHH